MSIDKETNYTAIRKTKIWIESTLHANDSLKNLNYYKSFSKRMIEQNLSHKPII
jgi:hypothetical protein